MRPAPIVASCALVVLWFLLSASRSPQQLLPTSYHTQDQLQASDPNSAKDDTASSSSSSAAAAGSGSSRSGEAQDPLSSEEPVVRGRPWWGAQRTRGRGSPGPCSTTSPNDSFPHSTAQQLCWSPGGVRGESEESVGSALDLLVWRLQRRSRRELTAECLASASWQSCKGLALLLVDTAKRLAALSESSHSGDCMFELLPHQRAACILLAAMDTNETRDNSGFYKSSCYAYTPCLLWQRGQFAHPLTSVMLQQVLRALKARLAAASGTAGDTDARLQGDALRRLLETFVVSNLKSKEFPLFRKRVMVQEEELARRFSRLSRWMSKSAAAGHGPEVNETTSSEAETSRHWDEEQTDLGPVFQGNAFHYDLHSRTVSVGASAKENHVPAGGGSRTAAAVGIPQLSPLEVLAVLHDRALLRPPRVDADLPTAAEKRFLNVIAFSGDSMSREVFMRLVHYLRFGACSSGSKSEGGGACVGASVSTGGQDRDQRHFGRQPFHEPSQHHDMIYAVHESHDELLLFHSPMSNHRSGRTVAQFLRSIRQEIRMHRRGKRPEGPPKLALLYVVYTWDPVTEWSRPELMVDVKFVGERMISAYTDDIVDASSCPAVLVNNSVGASLPGVNPPRELLASVQRRRQQLAPDALPSPKLLIGEFARTRRRDFGKHQLILPVDPKNPCMIRISVPKLKLTRAYDVGALSASLSLAPRRPRTSSVVSPSSSSFKEGGNESHAGRCTRDMADTADLLRRHLMKQEHMKYAARPVVPLREIGVGVAVHLHGNVFWDHAIYPELLQHFYVTALAVNSEVPEVKDVPRRAVPDDDTELYLMTSSFLDPSEPFFRHVMTGTTPSTQWSKKTTDSNTSSVVVRRHDEEADHAMPLGGEVIRSRLDSSSALNNVSSAAEVLLLRDDLDEDEPDMLSNVFSSTDEEIVAGIGGTDKPPQSSPSRNQTVGSGGTGNDTETFCMSTTPFLRGLPMLPSNFNNLVKNIHLYSWFQRLLLARQQRESFMTAANPKDSFRYYKSVNLIELDKLQFLRFRQGDDRHMSCRFSQVRSRALFDLSFEHLPLLHVLSPGTPEANAHIVGYTRTISGADAVGLIEESKSLLGPQLADDPSSTAVGESSAHPVTRLAVVHALLGLFSDPKANGLREQLWTISGIPRWRQPEVAGEENGDDEAILLLGDRREHGVLMHDDGEGCLDDGNQFVLQTLLWDLTLKRDFS